MKKINCLNIAGGCASKVEPKVLSKLLKNLDRKKNENILIGFENSDDACIYKIDDSLAMVQTLDFFPPMLDNPYIFGQIAATNALSDVYAMGGKPVTAMNIVCFPKDEDKYVLQEILRGGLEKIQEASASLVGGHSIYDEKIKYGLSVTGLIDLKQGIWANSGAKEGDVIYYTKRIGTGIITTANNDNIVSEEDFNVVINQMTTLNKYSYETMKKYPVSSCTDVTGFSFLGHSVEMAQNNDSISFLYDYNKIPKLPNVETYAKDGYICGGGIRNKEYFEEFIDFNNIEEWQKDILFDPQTSGGLLFTLAEDFSKDIEEDFQKNKLPLYKVGQVIKRDRKAIIIK